MQLVGQCRALNFRRMLCCETHRSVHIQPRHYSDYGNAEFLGEQTRVVGSNRQLKKNRNKIKRDRPHVGETLEALVQPMIAASSFRPARLSN